MHIEEGQNFERYHIIRRLGQSSSGISYEAEDRRLKSKVVLKLIQPWSETAYSARRQFFRDMQVLSVLPHPGLVAILNYGEVAGQLYLARRYMSRGSLLGNAGRALFPLPLMIKDAFFYTYQLAEVLHLIHSHDYVHGALAFSNVLLAEPGAEADSPLLLISDAWLAQFVRRFGQQQQNILPMTAAPEQYKGQTTPASDQYALAILLWVWLTGRPPFAGSPTEIEQLKLAEAIPALNVGLTGEQESIVRRALRTRPDARYPSVLAFAEELKASLQPVRYYRTETELIQASGREKELIQTPGQQEDFEAILQQLISAGTEKLEQSRPPEPLPQIQPDIPQPEPSPYPIPEPQPEPAETPAAPEPEVEPVIIPTPAPDIAQPIPEQTPFPPAPEPVQPEPSPEPETKPSAHMLTSHLSKPLPHPMEKDGVPIAYLTITSPFPREPRKVPLFKDEINLGRAGSSDILLDEDIITSRHHAQINREEGNYVIYDKRSTYGVIVNNQKLTDGVGQILKDGDHVQIGDYHLLFSLQPIGETGEAHVEHALLQN